MCAPPCNSTGAQAGLMEYLEGAESVDKIHKTLPRGMALKQYFELNFGESYSLFYAKAVKNFVRSLAGYSLLTYLVQVSCKIVCFLGT
jgi:phosphatidylinositol kinase/protein kinase (PI-3  family)